MPAQVSLSRQPPFLDSSTPPGGVHTPAALFATRNVVRGPNQATWVVPSHKVAAVMGWVELSLNTPIAYNLFPAAPGLPRLISAPEVTAFPLTYAPG